jgi:6-phosphogluconate dehydrogenase
MKLGYLGLGKMGKNMVLHLLEKGHEVVAWNRSPEPRSEVAAAGAQAVETVEEVVAALPVPRVIWVMLPAGDVTDQMITKLSTLLSPGDLVIDGGNTFYKDSQRHGELLTSKKIAFMDVGTSGGPAGARNGACLMIGGTDESLFQKYDALFRDISAPNAYQYFPGAGAGHFVKMVHNGIEYGMMQAIAEGFAVLRESPYKIDLLKAATIYNNRSVIESRLVGWLLSGYQKHGTELEDISGTVKHTGEGQWTVEAAKEMGIPVKVIEDSFQFRVQSETQPSYTGQVVSVLRNEFGGHEVKK